MKYRVRIDLSFDDEADARALLRLVPLLRIAVRREG
jgi:hypothetical protein